MSRRFLFSIVLVVLAASRIETKQNPAFSAKVEAVRVDVLVTEKGKTVLGLQASDFEVLDNGVRQHVDLITSDEVPLNVVLALDMSASVDGERLDHLRRACKSLLEGLKTHDRAALVTFSHVVTLRSRLTHDVRAVNAALDDAVASGDTALIDGLYTGMMIAESDASRALLIVFSDGLDTSSWLSADAVLQSARRSDAVVYAVSVRGPEQPAFLQNMTRATGDSLFEIDSTRNLTATLAGILEEFRHRYLVSYSPQGVAKDGWHRLDVRVKGRQATIKARPGYQSP